MTGDTLTHRLRVRYCETDRMGVSHHGSFVAWFEEARTEWLRARGKTYRAFEEEGVFLQVVELQVRYLAPTTYDDELLIRVAVRERKRASITIGYEVARADDGTAVATGATTLACVDRAGKLRRLPPEI
jgi:acyl-CoA thioester hydrolase